MSGGMGREVTEDEGGRGGEGDRGEDIHYSEFLIQREIYTYIRSNPPTPSPYMSLQLELPSLQPQLPPTPR